MDALLELIVYGLAIIGFVATCAYLTSRKEPQDERADHLWELVDNLMKAAACLAVITVIGTLLYMVGQEIFVRLF